MVPDPSISFNTSKGEIRLSLIFEQRHPSTSDKTTLHLSTTTRVLFRTSPPDDCGGTERVLGYCTTQDFLLPWEELFSEQHSTEILTKLIDFMNIPFSFEEKHVNCKLKNSLGFYERKLTMSFENVIQELIMFLQTLKGKIEKDLLGVRLKIDKVIDLPHDELPEWISWDKEYEDFVSKLPGSWTRWRMAALSVLERLRIEKGGDLAAAAEQFCSICLDNDEMINGAGSGVVELIKLPCTHVFHQDCILKWLKNNQSCPHCRAKTPKIETHENLPFRISCKSASQFQFRQRSQHSTDEEDAHDQISCCTIT